MPSTGEAKFQIGYFSWQGGNVTICQSLVHVDDQILKIGRQVFEFIGVDTAVVYAELHKATWKQFERAAKYLCPGGDVQLRECRREPRRESCRQ